MMIRRATRETHMVDLLDRILDKGIVIDVWARVVIAGLDFGIRWEVRMVVASFNTYLNHTGPLGLLDPIAKRLPPKPGAQIAGLAK